MRQTKGFFKRMKEEKDEAPERDLAKSGQSSANFHRDLMAGAIMGLVVHTIVAPIERAKLLLQTQNSKVAIVNL